MKKRLSILLFTVVILACACPVATPKETTAPPETTSPQVVFRSPGDMNLQPADVPDLSETEVTNPAPEPLLPEAEDQDQRAYVNMYQTIQIESNVIMLPDPTKRSIDDIYDTVVVKRRPKAQREGTDKVVNIGDQGRIIRFVDEYGPGYVLIFYRNNIIVVLIGWGAQVDEGYIERLGILIIDRILRPADPGELAVVTPARPATLTPLSQDEIEKMCSDLHLTPEECANAGTHTYSWEFHKISGFCADVVSSRSLNCQNRFFEGGLDFFCDGSDDTWNKIGENKYYFEIGISQMTLNFTLNGFIINYKSVYEGGATCEHVQTAVMQDTP